MARDVEWIVVNPPEGTEAIIKGQFYKQKVVNGRRRRQFYRWSPNLDAWVLEITISETNFEKAAGKYRKAASAIQGCFS